MWQLSCRWDELFTLLGRLGAGDAAVLSNHAEVMMHDLAAGLLLELERLMLTSTAAGVDLATALDTASDFQAAPGAASMLEAASSRLYNDEVRRGRRFRGFSISSTQGSQNIKCLDIQLARHPECLVSRYPLRKAFRMSSVSISSTHGIQNVNCLHNDEVHRGGSGHASSHRPEVQLSRELTAVTTMRCTEAAQSAIRPPSEGRAGSFTRLQTSRRQRDAATWRVGSALLLPAQLGGSCHCAVLVYRVLLYRVLMYSSSPERCSASVLTWV